MTWILTHTGIKFDLLEPTADMIHPRDIAHALSQLCRFNGHTHKHYSVAEHSIRVAQIVPVQYQLVALLHDATEAYVGDMVRPLKQVMPEFRTVEKRIWQAICERFDLPEILPTSVHAADMTLLATERRDLMPEHPGQWDCLQGVTPLTARIVPCNAVTAEVQFLTLLMELLATTHRAKVQGGAA
ncbi:MAG: phosphohydrolase [Halopseudomonas sp.]|uniref:phosphohydrolase n=1 Tax=Halopseudomonas sp. TaxID=2901191 RepID=UPI003002DF51